MMTWFDQYLLGIYKEVHIVLHAQKYLENFYKKLGYRVKGKPFLEANIEHIEMEKTIQRAIF
jgi:predicted GNAT family N-acyltransferase